MTNTILSFLDDTYKFADNSQLLEIQDALDGSKAIILDHTIMYAQGGGQPYDTGKMNQGELVFLVKEVRYKDGIVYHIGEFTSENFKTNSSVEVYIDEERRRLHAKLHTAGHLVDDAMFALGHTLQPLKGYHFPDGPYVEYIGELDGDLTQISKDVESKINEIIQTNYQVHSEIVASITDLKDRCLYVPEHIPEGKPIRIIYASAPTKGQPCGGTHVKYLREIGHVTIPKIKTKGGNTRVSYLVN